MTATVDGDGFVAQAISYQVTPDKDLDLGAIRLEQPVQISIEYIVAEGSAGAFDSKAKDLNIIADGVKWKSQQMTEWDLEFGQSGSTIQFNYPYAPCTLADLLVKELWTSLSRPTSTKQSSILGGCSSRQVMFTCSASALTAQSRCSVSCKSSKTVHG